LDLTIEIDASSNKITTKTYQKPTNLNLYIPATSAYPEACIQGTVVSNFIRYWKQNSSVKDFRTLREKFTEQICHRVHEDKNVTACIEKATTYIDEDSIQKKDAKMNLREERIFFQHWQYHP
jgi:hypothetical protein